MTRDPIGEDGGLNLYQFVSNDPVDTVDRLGLSGCKVKSFDIKVNGWRGAWPRYWVYQNYIGGPIHFGALYTKRLDVEFHLELDGCCNKNDCLIDQLKRGIVKRGGRITGPFPDWVKDGPSLWWDGNNWGAQGLRGSWGWRIFGNDKKATFHDEPGFDAIPKDQFPIYWGGVGGHGYFEFKTRVLDSATYDVVQELDWGILIEYSSPDNGSQSYYH